MCRWLCLYDRSHFVCLLKAKNNDCQLLMVHKPEKRCACLFSLRKWQARLCVACGSMILYTKPLKLTLYLRVSPFPFYFFDRPNSVWPSKSDFGFMEELEVSEVDSIILAISVFVFSMYMMQFQAQLVGVIRKWNRELQMQHSVCVMPLRYACNNFLWPQNMSSFGLKAHDLPCIASGQMTCIIWVNLTPQRLLTTTHTFTTYTR